jgi:glutamate--cysteine ligase
MQAIAGVHYNFSMPESYWPLAWEADGAEGSLQDYSHQSLPGADPQLPPLVLAADLSVRRLPCRVREFYARSRDHPLQPFDGEGNSLYLPHATALRMGNLGYNSSAQKSLRVCYNSLDNYLATLTEAILTPHPPYAAYRGMQDGEYMQLNDSLLQIENEFYSTHPPQTPRRAAARPRSRALQQRGIEYVEVRCIDVSPFPRWASMRSRSVSSTVSSCTACPAESPACDEDQQARQDANLEAVVNRGREPGLNWRRAVRCARSLGRGTSRGIGASAELLDKRPTAGTAYAGCPGAQRAKVPVIAELPSARVLREMREKPALLSLCAALQQSLERALRPAPATLRKPSAGATRAPHPWRASGYRGRRHAVFEDYLAAYYRQYEAIRAGD